MRERVREWHKAQARARTIKIDVGDVIRFSEPITVAGKVFPVDTHWTLTIYG